MACGRAVVCSDRSSIPEVAGEAGLLFNPEDEVAIAHSLESVLLDSDLRARMERLGISRASQFTWRNAAEETLEVYREVAGLPARAHATVEV